VSNFQPSGFLVCVVIFKGEKW